MQRCASGPSPWHASRLGLSTKVAFFAGSLYHAVASHRFAAKRERGGNKRGAAGTPLAVQETFRAARRASPATFFRLYPRIDRCGGNDAMTVSERRGRLRIYYCRLISIDKIEVVQWNAIIRCIDITQQENFLNLH